MIDDACESFCSASTSFSRIPPAPYLQTWRLVQCADEALDLDAFRFYLPFSDAILWAVMKGESAEEPDIAFFQNAWLLSLSAMFG